MSAIHTQVIDASGAEALVAQTQAVTMEGQNETMAVDDVAVVIASAGTGQLVVTDVTNSESAVFNLHQLAGVAVIAKAYGSAAINAAAISFIKGTMVTLFSVPMALLIRSQ